VGGQDAQAEAIETASVQPIRIADSGLTVALASHQPAPEPRDSIAATARDGPDPARCPDENAWQKLPRGIAFAVLLAIPLWLLALALWLFG
jgi:hypothetical protein